MNIGQRVLVPVYGGEIVERVVVEIIDNKVVVATYEECKNSIIEERPARGVGYYLENVSAP
jgi:hypothetical protein